jgi:tRNA pseudouridine55 synthase
VGHAGTLDPMATGLLLLGVGSSTRLLTFLVGLDKQYTATIRLGQATDTDDADGEIVSTTDASGVTRAAIDSGVVALTGAIEQIPSTFSAIKVDGRRAYDLARSGEQVELKPREVTISRFEILDERREDGFIELDVVVDVSSGTYVRALARDLGASLGVGGHLTALRRTRVGGFAVEDAADADHLADAPMLSAATVASALFPTVTFDRDDLVAMTQGKRVAVPVADAPRVAVLTPGGGLAGIVSVADGRARVVVNFPTDEVLAP